MNFKDFVAAENVIVVAEEIVTAFENEASSNSLEIDFKLNAGVMEVNYTNNADFKAALEKLHGRLVPSPNTSLSFNAPENSVLCKIKDYFCQNINNSTITENDYEIMHDFLTMVIRHVNQNQVLLERIKRAVRKVNGADEILFPFKDTMVVLFEFGEKEDYGDMIKVLHYSRYNKQLQSFVGEKKAVAQDLLLRRRQFGYNSKLETKEIYAKIIDEQKMNNNPLYEDILIEDVKIVREAKECHLDIFINYSPLPQDEYVAKAKEIGEQNG